MRDRVSFLSICANVGLSGVGRRVSHRLVPLQSDNDGFRAVFYAAKAVIEIEEVDDDATVRRFYQRPWSRLRQRY